MNLVTQKNNVYNLKANQIAPKSENCSNEDEEAIINNNIYINESLAMYNRQVIIKGGKVCRELNYQRDSNPQPLSS